MYRVLLCVLLASSMLLGCDSNPTEADPDDKSLAGFGVLTADSVSAGAFGGLLINGGMEEDAGWWFYGPPEGSRGYTSEAHYAGVRSVAISQPSRSGPAGVSIIGQSVDIRGLGARTVTLTARIKTEGIEGHGVAVALRGDVETVNKGDADLFTTTQLFEIITGSSGWKPIHLELSEVPSEIKTLSVYLILLPESSGTVYFDDVELTYTEIAPVRSLANGSFELGYVTPTDWIYGATDKKKFMLGWDGVESFDGDKAVSLFAERSLDEHFAYWGQIVGAEDFLSGPAVLRVWIKTELEGYGASIALGARSSTEHLEFVSTQDSTSITGTQDWTEYSLVMDHVPFGAKTFVVYGILLPETSGTVIFDDFRLTKQ